MTEHRAWGGYRFERFAELDPARSPDGQPLELMPQARYARAATAKLHTYGHGPYCSFKVPWSYADAGVYVVTVDERPVYVGECRHLAQRFNMGYGSIQPRNCFEGGQRTNCKVNMKVLEVVKSGQIPVLWFVARDDRKRVEAELLRLLQPPWNGRQWQPPESGRRPGASRGSRPRLDAIPDRKDWSA